MIQTRRSAYRAAFFGFLLVTPLVVSLLLGVDGMPDSVFEVAHCLGTVGDGGTLPCHSSQGAPTLSSPLYDAVLFALARLGAPVPWSALVLSALGWSAAAVSIYALGRELNLRSAGTPAAILVAVSPAVVATAGTPAAWTVGLAWWAIAATLTRRRRAQVLGVGLLLATHLSLGTLALTLILLGITWRQRARLPVRLSVTIIGALGLWLTLIGLGWVGYARPALSLGVWAARGGRLLAESELYWMALPLLIGGAASVTHRSYRLAAAGLVWSMALGLDGGAAAAATVGTLGLVLTCIGAAGLITWLETERYLRGEGALLRFGLALVVLLPVGAAQTASVVDRARAGLAVHRELEAQAGAWLQEESPPDAAVLGSARLGYLARRETWIWGGASLGSRTPDQLDRAVAALKEEPPDYCVSYRSLAWDDLLRTGWFQDTYMPVTEFASAYAGTSPFTVWALRPREFNLGDYRPLSIRLPGNAYWVGTRYTPERIRPGETFSVTLFRHEPQPDPATPLPFDTAVYLDTPDGSEALVEAAGALTRDVVLSEPALGRVSAEHFSLTPPQDLAYGAYRLSAAIITEDIDRRGFIYEGDSAIPIERATLGYVIVPWEGSLAEATPVGAHLADQITLVAFEIEGDPAPGVGLTVNLYWEALRPLGDVSAVYHVFVHLLDGNGELVTQDDSLPVRGRYPLQAWAPGDMILDAHPLTLPPDLAPGTYRIQAGMYTWPDFTRLEVRDAGGEVQPDGVMVLGEIAVR